MGLSYIAGQKICSRTRTRESQAECTADGSYLAGQQLSLLTWCWTDQALPTTNLYPPQHMNYMGPFGCGSYQL